MDLPPLTPPEMKVVGEKVPWHDVQGLLNYGYRHLPHGRYLLLRIEDPVSAKFWLSGIGKRLTNAKQNPEREALNLAVTAGALRRLEVSHEALASFSSSFTDGMVTPHRSRILGDFGPNDPTNWHWGGTADSTPDILLMVFAAKPEQAVEDAERILGEATGCSLLGDLNIEANLPVGRDHFGFVDGIAQPKIAGTPARDGKFNNGDIVAGEFLVGQMNQYRQYEPIPKLGDEPDGKEFGRNGSYLVLRQMDQKPDEFHEFCLKNDAENPDRVGSLLVGRWPNGSPISKYPDKPGPATTTENDFLFGDDPFGAKCPIGAHIRRANPRDGLRGLEDPITSDIQKTSLETVAHHRLLRRGRMYGTPWRPDCGQPCPQETRGLHFLCLNASIQNQFEMVQQTWISGMKFLGLYDEVDPMVGIGLESGGGCSFTIQGQPGELRKRLEGIPRFITVRGGAYFFLPTISAVEMLGTLD